MDELDIGSNRIVSKYSNNEMIKRIFWTIGIVFFKLTPRNFFLTRNSILKIFGAKIGKAVHIYPSATIYFPWNLTIGDYSAIGENALIYNLGSVEIGKNVTISHLAQICAGTHDYSEPDMPLLKPKIVIEDNVWICTQAFVGPGIIVKKGAVIGACAVLTKDSQPWKVYAGNPAKAIKDRIMKR